jgi:hypothetical protein
VVVGGLQWSRGAPSTWRFVRVHAHHLACGLSGPPVQERCRHRCSRCAHPPCAGRAASGPCGCRCVRRCVPNLAGEGRVGGCGCGSFEDGPGAVAWHSRSHTHTHAHSRTWKTGPALRKSRAPPRTLVILWVFARAGHGAAQTVVVSLVPSGEELTWDRFGRLSAGGRMVDFAPQHQPLG